MIREVARVVGLVMIANAAQSFLFPGADTRFLTRGPGRKWKFPGKSMLENFSCLSVESRLFLAAWEGLAGILLYAMAATSPTGEAAGYGQLRSTGPVRVPIHHVR